MCKFVIHFSCVINITLQLLNVLVEVELKIISLSWFAASISLVHRNPLCEHCSLVDHECARGKCTISHQVVYRTWCRVLGSTSPPPPTHKSGPYSAFSRIGTWPIRCWKFLASTLGKQFWRMMHCKTSLLFKVFSAKLFPSGDIMESAEHSKGSFAWRSIMNAKRLTSGLVRARR